MMLKVYNTCYYNCYNVFACVESSFISVGHIDKKDNWYAAYCICDCLSENPYNSHNIEKTKFKNYSWNYAYNKKKMLE